MPVLFDSSVRRNPASFGFGVYSLDHTPTPLADILRAHYAHPSRVTKARPFRPYTTVDESWNLGWTLGREWDGNYDTFPMPAHFATPKHRQAWMDGFEAGAGIGSNG